MEPNCIAETEYGKVRGEVKTSLLDVPYLSFLGIPYAAPPVGKLRFKAPQKPAAWGNQIIDALEEKSPCAGKNNYIKQFVGSDDCLYMNIFTKDLKPQKPYPVLFYIHGGGHSSGSSTLYSYSPDYIMLSDIVLVTFNFRIGPLGFLSLKDKSLDVPGNAGMKDQQLAMQFVRDNIHFFGGDPNNVTLVGHSTGATCVSLHCTVESSKGLFHRAIIMSGSSTADDGLVSDKNWALRLANRLGYDGSDDERKILDFLEQADVLKMAEEQHALIESNEKPFSTFAFGPCVEPYETESSFMLAPPVSLLRTTWSNDIDVMLGGTANEGKGMTRGEMPSLELLLPVEIRLSADQKKIEEFAERLRKCYFTRNLPEMEAYELLKGDEFRWLHMQRLIHARRNSGKKGKTFFYRFSVDSPTQNHYRNRWFGLGSRGVSHADELSYLWKNGQGDVPDRNSIEFTSIMRFTSLLTSFVATGDPNANVLKAPISVFWKPIESSPYHALVIDKELEFKILPESERVRELWEAFYEETSVPLF